MAYKQSPLVCDCIYSIITTKCIALFTFTELSPKGWVGLQSSVLSRTYSTYYYTILFMYTNSCRFFQTKLVIRVVDGMYTTLQKLQ